MTYASRTSFYFGRLLAQLSSGNGKQFRLVFGIVRISVVRFTEVDCNVLNNFVLCHFFQSEEFKMYQTNVVKNAQTMAAELEALGYRVVTGGTDNHIVLLDMSTVKLSGAKAERILELVEVSVNKNTGTLCTVFLCPPKTILYCIDGGNL